VTKDDTIQALKQELEAAKKLAGENKAARKATKEQIEKICEDFDVYRRQKRDERNKVVADAQKVRTCTRS